MISIKNIYWMMAYAFRNINEQEIKKIKEENFENIYELLCTMITIELSKLIKKGLCREYITVDEELSSLKGKILINESIKKNLQLKAKMYCSYDEYSSNIYLNKIIKSTCMYLIKSKKVKDIIKIRKLKNVLSYLNDIEELESYHINWNSIKYSKNNKMYRVIINICYLVFNGLLLNREDGSIEFRNYIDDQEMHKLYEKFILEYYRCHYHSLSANASEIEWNTSDMINLLPKMQSDIMLYSGDRKLIIDAKYYSNMYQSNQYFNKEKFKSNNLYQIFTYVKNEDKEENGKVTGMLLYAKTDDNDEQWLVFKLGKNEFIISNLDLSEDFEKVEKHLNMIAERFINNEL
ncbi:MAG: 5-methylcytosine-specific restriction endonuclease system specificity protein McrC [Bacilli bacterium]|nr:5-methylcytosine-specific restriction endonuclease system specificity protein McrC [Bacilli bacterium]